MYFYNALLELRTHQISRTLGVYFSHLLVYHVTALMVQYARLSDFQAKTYC